MRLEPQERRDYVHSQLDDYGRCYMECLEMFVYRLWSRQRLLLKNCKLYQEKIGTMREVMESLTGRDKIVESNNAESEKLEESIKKIHKVVWIPPYKDADIEVLDELFFKEEAESLDVVSLALSPGGSRMLSPLVMAPIDRTGVRQLSVIKSQSSSPSPSSSYERGSNNNEKEMATSSVRVNGSSRGVRQGSSVITSPQNSSNQSRRSEINLKVSPNLNSLSNGHVSVISSSVSNRVINRQSRAASECLNSAAAIAAVQAVVSNHIRSSSNNQSNNNNSNQSYNNTTSSNNINNNNANNNHNNTNGRGSNGNGINGLHKEADSNFTSRRNGSSKRSNGSASGSVPKKSRNNRTKDDKEIVKCCAQESCDYIERDNANNMRKHYRNWHDDIDYPPNPYFKKEMTTETVNQCLHNWMIQRKKKQPRAPRSETRVSDDWRTTMALTGLVVCESDATYEDEDYEINEHLLTTFTEGEEEAKPLDVSNKRES